MPIEDVQYASKQLEKRIPELEKARDYFEGTMPEVFASPKLRRALQRTGAHFRINFSKVPVEAVLNRLEITTIHVDDNQAAEVIANIWDSNELDFEISEVHKNTLVYGDSYLMVSLDDSLDPDNPEVVITYESPLTTQIFYEHENPRRKKYAIKMWREGKEGKRANLYYPDTIEKYYQKDKESPWTLEEEVENPFGVIPLFHFRTARPHGRPEHADAFGVQDMINKIVITQMATNDYQGFPQRYALANPDDPMGSSDFDDFPDEDSDSPVGSLAGGPGELWYMKGVSSVGQFETADAESFLQPLREYVKAMAATTDTPIHLFEGIQGSTSGEHLRAAEAPLNKKVRNRQLLFGKTWEEVFAFLLALVGINDVSTAVVWAPPETNNDKDAWEVAKLKMDAGVPFEMVLSEMGYSPDEVDQMISLKAQQGPPTETPEEQEAA